MIVLSDARVVGVGASAGTHRCQLLLGHCDTSCSRLPSCLPAPSPGPRPQEVGSVGGGERSSAGYAALQQLFIARAWKADPAGRRVGNVTSVLGSNNECNFSSAADGT